MKKFLEKYDGLIAILAYLLMIIAWLNFQILLIQNALK